MNRYGYDWVLRNEIDIKMSRFSETRLSAWLQNIVSKRREETGLYREIAEVLPLAKDIKLLDVGTGSGLQLKVIHEMESTVELYGIDLSLEAIKIAERNLREMKVDLRVESIEETSFDDKFFDIITRNASMSFWENLPGCFNEIYRILKPVGRAVLFEPRKNINVENALKILRQNMAEECWLRQFAAVTLNRFALRRGRTIGLNLYQMEEIKSIAGQSRFRDSVSVKPVTLQDIPIFMKIVLQKPNRMPQD